MNNNTTISNNIKYIGANDNDIDLFESQYQVPNGISYNSYLIRDDKIVIMDTIDKRKTDEWINKLTNELGDDTPDYLVVSHLEPDHAYNIELIANKYPKMKIIGNVKTFEMIPQFFNIQNLEERKVVVKEKDEINIGQHTLQFFMAPMVHWPEVMVTYEKKEKILFSADGFGKFGSLDTHEDWACEARRYYFNIVGKYGMQVQMLLKKLSDLEIKIICPLHGPILKDNLNYYIEKYDIWSKYEPEDDGVFIAYASIHGNTAEVAKELVDMLKDKGVKNVVISDLARADLSECIEDAFRYNKMIVAASSYNMGVFPPMENFVRQLASKNYQNRTIGIIENGSWAPTAAKCMKEIISNMKNINLCEEIVTIKSRLDERSKSEIENLINEIINN